jgi:superfamily II DNA or RNA helicase
MEDKRSLLQQQYGDLWETYSDGILLLSVRFGKSRTSLLRINKGESVLLSYHSVTQKKDWLREIDKWVPDLKKDIVLTTHTSLKKYARSRWDYVIYDEVHKMSDAQLNTAATITFKRRMLITGTASKWTLINIRKRLGAGAVVIAEYPLEQAIRDGFVADYRITCIPAFLDNTRKTVKLKGRNGEFYETELYAYNFYNGQYNLYKSREDALLEQITILNERLDNGRSKIQEISKDPNYRSDPNKVVEVNNLLVAYNLLASKKGVMETEVEKLKFLRKIVSSKRMNVIYNSESKLNVAQKLLEKYEGERCIIFTKRTDIADRVTSKTYHSKNRDKEALQDFIDGVINHIGVAEAVNVGVTLPKVKHCIVQQYDSNPENLVQKINRITTFEHDNPDKMADVNIVYLAGTQDEEWLRTALSFFDPKKITYAESADWYFSRIS